MSELLSGEELWRAQSALGCCSGNYQAFAPTGKLGDETRQRDLDVKLSGQLCWSLGPLFPMATREVLWCFCPGAGAAGARFVSRLLLCPGPSQLSYSWLLGF